MLEIRPYQEDDHRAWDELVRRHPEGRVCHLVGYGDMVRITFGYRPYYRCLWRQGNLVGVFPAFVVRPWLGAPRFVSQPFIEYGGLLFDGEIADDDLVTVREEVQKALRESGARFLEIHGGFGLPPAQLESVSRETELCEYAILPLTGENEIWQKGVSRHVRKAVRKAERSGVECFEDTSISALDRNFYPLYLRSMKRLGSPPHSLAFFHNTLKCLSGHTKLFIALSNGSAVAALLGFTTGDRVHIVFSVSDPASWEVRPNDLVHWKFIEWACTHGYKWFDFGTARYPSQRQYKEKWGVEFRKYSHYFMPAAHEASVNRSLNSASPRIQLLSTIWRTCVPGRLARLMGPPLHRGLAI